MELFSDYLEQGSYLAVFILAAIPWIELAVVIPLAIVIGLHPLIVSVLAFIGNWLTVALLIVWFDRWNQWRERRRERKGIQPAESSSRKQRAHRIWQRYGLPGLALAGPLLIGSHIAAAVAMAFKAEKKAVMVWMSVSLLLWTVLTAVIAYYGLFTLGFIRDDFFTGR